MKGILYVVATPLGNPGDVSRRAVETLRDADAVVAEDTRTAKRLLSDLGIDRRGRPLLSCYDANEAERAAEVVALLDAGRTVALVSEAGTPGVSDPGFRIVRAAVEAGARVVPVPGPSAVVAALSASGLPTDRFVFAGFPPRRDGPRGALLESLRALPITLVFYESPVRTGATLAALRDALGDRPACVARELTKTHEEIVRGRLGDLAGRYRDQRPLGEVTIVVGGASGGAAATDGVTGEEMGRRARDLLAAGRTARDAAAEIAGATGRSRREVYDLVNRVRGRR